jgi:propanol-preferring alcohol dehydrogenase
MSKMTAVQVAKTGGAFEVSALALLSGKTIAGWPSGTAIDSEETIALSVLTNFELAEVDQALASMESRVRFAPCWFRR